MPKANKQSQNKSKNKRIDVPQPKKKTQKELGVPKLKGLQRAVDAKAAKAARGALRNEQTMARLLATSTSTKPLIDDLPDVITPQDAFSTLASTEHLSALRDSSTRAFTRELKKVIDRSDVIVQVLDARDPEGTRSRWVEEEVRKKESEGKRLMGVVNKIDLVPRDNLEAWLKHLRHSFPVMPFKSSTQSQRQNLSQAAIHLSTNATSSKTPLGASSSASTQKTTSDPIPTTSASLGAPALLQLLKKYASTHPHQTLTVGFIGYPNVGKSSLINSLKRSRACPVAVMPGKTRVMQEVVLDKGVKVLDCPGVVLDDFDRMGLNLDESEKGKRKGAVLLRNCVKVEEVEDPMAAVEEILRRVEVSKMMELYEVPEYKNVTEFLVRVALTRGRLGKGGIPDLIAAATAILRDWNAGKIPYHTQPPKIHPSANLTKETELTAPAPEDEMQVENGQGQQGGDAILSGLGQAFDLDGLFASFGGGEFDEDEEAWEDEAPVSESQPIEEDEDVDGVDLGIDDVDEPEMPVDQDLLDRMAAGPSTSAAPAFAQTAAALPTSAYASSSTSATGPRINPLALFTPAERALLPNNPNLNPLDRKALKQKAKKQAKRSREAEKQERAADEDMFDAAALFGSMNVTQPKRVEVKKKKKTETGQKGQKVKGSVVPVTMDAETQKELDFMSFLNSVGAEGGDDDDDMEL